MEYKLPDLGEGVLEAEIVNWMVRPGDVVEREQPLAEVMTDKAVMELPSPFAGKVTEICAEAGETVAVHTVMLKYTTQSEAEQTETREEVAVAAATDEQTVAVDESSAQPAEPSTATASGNGQTQPSAAPAVKRFAERLGINLAEVAGSGPDGRVLIDDLADLVQRVSNDAPQPKKDDNGFGEPGTRIPFRALRRRIAERMLHATHTIPHYSYMDECDASELVRLRNEWRPKLAESGIRLTYLPFFLQAVVSALKQVPLVNSSLDEATGEIVLHDEYHIGIATATRGGLVVPVVRNADQMDLRDIAEELARLTTTARNGRLKREELTGSTFTVTSIGGIGGLISTPIINYPEVGILGIGRIVRRPMYDALGQLRAAEMVYLSFSFDHRVVDGAVGAAFGNAVIRGLERPIQAAAGV